jgi:hypothetical protein
MGFVKALFLAGVLLIFLSGIFFLIEKTGFPFGRLPGDIHIKYQNTSVYFPLATCLLISFVISLMFYFFRR